jgi:archaellum component FlaC
MLADIQRIEESIKKDLNTFDGNTLKGIDDKVSELRNQAEKLLALLIETRAGIEARILQRIPSYV